MTMTVTDFCPLAAAEVASTRPRLRRSAPDPCTGCTFDGCRGGALAGAPPGLASAGPAACRRSSAGRGSPDNGPRRRSAVTRPGRCPCAVSASAECGGRLPTTRFTPGRFAFCFLAWRWRSWVSGRSVIPPAQRLLNASYRGERARPRGRRSLREAAWKGRAPAAMPFQNARRWVGRMGAPWLRFVWSCRECPDPAGRRRVKRSVYLRPKGSRGQ
jgi:hypothetical protein